VVYELSPPQRLNDSVLAHRLQQLEFGYTFAMALEPTTKHALVVE
jgi:hypothetical protein